jgi:DNA polymerase elongation subunit (family B)
MGSINAHVMDKKNKAKKQEPRPWHYWICRKQRGQLSEVMADLIKRKIAYKKLGETLKEKALKILMNSGYGCFKQAYFDYQDPRVAELITAYGQYTIKGFAKFIGDENVIYGDTDSIYLTSKNDTLVAEAAKINVDLEVDKEWKILCLSSNKKQYFGITQQGALLHKTLTGMKSDHPVYFKEVARKLISKEFQESFITSDTASALEKILTYLTVCVFLIKPCLSTLQDSSLAMIISSCKKVVIIMTHGYVSYSSGASQSSSR